MDLTTILQPALNMLWWILPLGLLITIAKTPWFKGLAGELLVKGVTKVRLPADTYHAIHNVTLPTPDGTTQIDHIIVSRFGIFVVETKNMKGWIFGGEHQAQWTQKIFKKSVRFQNPLRQNYKHVKTLEAALNVPVEVIHSVVVFAGEAVFKTPMPPNVTKAGGYIRYVRSFHTPVLSETKVNEVIAKIEEGRLRPSWQTNRQHVEKLTERREQTNSTTCPKCGAAMVLRQSRKGSNAGSQFWGCSGYPKCRETRAIEQL